MNGIANIKQENKKSKNESFSGAVRPVSNYSISA
jgi:hypothetical protein